MSFPVRLLNTHTYELHKSDHQDVRKDKRYAILSHRWGDDEIQLRDLDPAILFDPSKYTDALDKIRGACRVVRDASIQWLWIDTCCIDKTDAVEEARSINAMFDWYKEAEFCITYLHEVDSRVAARNSRLQPLTRTRGGFTSNQVSE
jgi:hypothetical protein